MQAEYHTESSSITPTPSLAPVGDQTTAPGTTTSAPEASDATAAPAETSTMTPKQDDTPEPAVKTPSPEQVASAVDGTLNASGVVLRQGPSGSYAILGKYSAGTQLKVYEVDGDYYFVKIVKENVYGYMAVKFVDKAGSLPGEDATPRLRRSQARSPGLVSASVVALRSVRARRTIPDWRGHQVTSVSSILRPNDFYTSVVDTGVKCYAVAQYITPAQPTGGDPGSVRTRLPTSNTNRRPRPSMPRGVRPSKNQFFDGTTTFCPLAIGSRAAKRTGKRPKRAIRFAG
jgi:hypothetical protein